MSCRVRKCRYDLSHVTIEHICGKCKQTGHGVKECGIEHMVEALTEFYSDVVANPCRVCGSVTHTVEGHLCGRCSRYGVCEKGVCG